MIKELFDDKIQVIWALLILGLFSMWLINDPTTIVSSIISGMLGVAVGKGVTNDKNTNGS